MTDSILIALVSPENVIDRIVRRETIHPDAGLKEGWRWLPVIEAYGEPYGDSVEDDAVYRRKVDPATLPPPRPTVRKSVVQDRIIAAGKMEDAHEMLNAYPVLFAKWFVPDPDRNFVYCDAEDAVQFVTELGLDPAEILAAD